MVAVLVGVTGCTLFQNEHVKKGRELYAYYCSHCHGENGKPGEGYNWKLMPDPKPKDLTNKDEMSTLKDEETLRDRGSRYEGYDSGHRGQDRR